MMDEEFDRSREKVRLPNPDHLCIRRNDCGFRYLAIVVPTIYFEKYQTVSDVCFSEMTI